MSVVWSALLAFLITTVGQGLELKWAVVALAFTVLAILAFRRLATVSGRSQGAPRVDGSIIGQEPR